MRMFDLVAVRRLAAGLATAGLLSVGVAGGALAQDDTAASGNGGVSDAGASGGSVRVADVASGESDGGLIGDLEAIFAGLFGGEDEATEEESADAEVSAEG